MKRNNLKKTMLYVLILTAAMFLLALLLWPTTHARALPEYSAQVGEPCATCHISPSGGGARTPRGQAWVGASKPGAVPGLLEALELLGVDLQVNESDYTDVPQSIPAARPLSIQSEQAEAIHKWLTDYEGN